MKRMLINASQPEELRLAMVDGQALYDFDIEQLGYERKRSNIYKAKVSRVERSLGAAFVDFGAEKHGFLPIKEIAPQYLPKGKLTPNVSINDCLKEGQELIIQVEKEERGTKGAAVTTFITLAGHYIVLLPNTPDAGGISRSLEGKDRESIKKTISSLEVPENMGLIVRTAAKGANRDELNWDLEYLLSVWDAIIEANQLRKAPFLVYRESDLITRSLRDYLRDDIKEVLVDSEKTYEKALDFVTKLMPEFQERVIQYTDTTPLFSKYQIEAQIDSAQQREVTLPSGGSISIDQTEALVAIDINSAKSTRGTNIEDTASKTNLEAAKEIAKQLRLRDIGGLVVIDFIDMTSLKNKRQVEEAVWDAVAMDRAKIQIGRISRFGLLEMSRQRLRPSLQERWQQDMSSLSTNVLRLIEEESAKENSLEIRAKVSTDMSVYLLNERRARINEIEQKASIRVVIKSDPTRDDDRYEVVRIKINDAKNNSVPLDNKTKTSNQNKEKNNSTKTKEFEKAAVNIKPSARPTRKQDGFFGRLIKNLLGKGKDEKKPLPSTPKSNVNTTQNKSRNYQGKNQNKSKPKNNNNYQLKGDKQKIDEKKPKQSKPHSKPKKKVDNVKSSKVNQDVDGNVSLPNQKENGNQKVIENQKTTVKKIKKAKDWGTASNDPRKEDPSKDLNKTIDRKEENNSIKETTSTLNIESQKEDNKQTKVSQQSTNKELETKKLKVPQTGKDWGTASNDPRNKN